MMKHIMMKTIKYITSLLILMFFVLAGCLNHNYFTGEQDRRIDETLAKLNEGPKYSDLILESIPTHVKAGRERVRDQMYYHDTITQHLDTVRDIGIEIELYQKYER